MTQPKAYNPCYIDKVSISELWEEKDHNITITFSKDVNIIIGPNASGKTTILNIIQHVLTGDIASLGAIRFKRIIIELKEFESKGRNKIEVETTSSGFKFSLNKESFNIDMNMLQFNERHLILRKGSRQNQPSFFSNEHLLRLSTVAPLVSLPVSRRLPIAEEEEEAYISIPPRLRKTNMESVDVRLRELINELTRYRLGLEAQLAVRYKNFEKQVLQSMLFSKRYDQISNLQWEAVSNEAKDQLIRAFDAAGLLDDSMSMRIEEHFKEANQALARLKEDPDHVGLDDVFIIPLISRTNALADSARELEKERETLFEPLATYERIVNSFINPKVLKVQNDGKVQIQSSRTGQSYSLLNLSSGEKQILILLTQALLKEDEPVIYIADEPELSLHVTWQEQLLKSLVELGKQIQIIVATHSPDIVGSFGDRVITLK